MQVKDSSISDNDSPLIPMPPEQKIENFNDGDRPVTNKRKLSWKIATNLLISFKYAWEGLNYTFVNERNFRIHTIVGLAAIALGIFLGLTTVKIAVIGLTVGLVMGMELLNTAIESVVDLTVKKEYHDLARIAKDCGAAAVLVSAIVSVLVASLLLCPPLLDLVMSRF